MTNAIILGIIITAIIAVGLVMHYMGNVLSEFSDHFFHLTIFLLIFLIGAAFYMSYALPSIAITRPETNDDIKVYRDNPPHKTLMETFFEE